MVYALDEDGGDDGSAVAADGLPGAADVLDVVFGQSGDGVGHILGLPAEFGRSNIRCISCAILESRDLLERLDDGGGQSAESADQGLLGLGGEATAQLVLQDGHEHLTELLEHVGLGAAAEVGHTQVVEFLGEQFLAAQRLDDHVETGGDGVGLGQEVAVLQQLGLGHVGEGGEHLLVLGVGLDEAEQNFGGDASVLAGSFPGGADQLVGATSAASRCADGGDGRDRDSGLHQRSTSFVICVS